MKKRAENKKVVIYQAKNGAIELRGDASRETMWATQAQIAKNYNAFMKSVADIQLLLPEHVALDPKSILELVKEFSSTWMLLDAYDKESLTIIGSTKREVKFTGMVALVTRILK